MTTKAAEQETAVGHYKEGRGNRIATFHAREKSAAHRLRRHPLVNEVAVHFPR
jgi:hypothetical protein